MSCARSPCRAADAGEERPVRPTGYAAAAPGPIITPGTEHAGYLRLLAGLVGPLPPLPRDTDGLRGNAVSPHGVRLSGAPGAPLWNGCSSANRTLAGKLLWDGIVAVPEVSGAGCLALSSVGRMRAARPSGRFPAHPPGLRRHGDARRNAQRCGNRGYLAAGKRAARIKLRPPRGRCTGRRAQRVRPGGRESWKDH